MQKYKFYFLPGLGEDVAPSFIRYDLRQVALTQFMHLYIGDDSKGGITKKTKVLRTMVNTHYYSSRIYKCSKSRAFAAPQPSVLPGYFLFVLPVSLSFFQKPSLTATPIPPSHFLPQAALEASLSSSRSTMYYPRHIYFLMTYHFYQMILCPWSYPWT